MRFLGQHYAWCVSHIVLKTQALQEFHKEEYYLKIEKNSYKTITSLTKAEEGNDVYVTPWTTPKRGKTYSYFVAKATENVQLIKRWAAVWLKPRNGDLSIFRRDQMSLTYRGLKYNQHKTVAEKQHVQLTYRGKSYQN